MCTGHQVGSSHLAADHSTSLTVPAAYETEGLVVVVAEPSQYRRVDSCSAFETECHDAEDSVADVADTVESDSTAVVVTDVEVVQTERTLDAGQLYGAGGFAGWPWDDHKRVHDSEVESLTAWYWRGRLETVRRGKIHFGR